MFNRVALQAALWTRKKLTPANLRWLQALPEGPVIVDGQFAIAHGTPIDEDAYIFGEIEALNVFRQTAFPLCFFGHSHFPVIFGLSPDAIQTVLTNGASFRFRLEPGVRYLVNPGSIGQPRDGNPLASYAIFDSGTRTVTISRVPYPVAARAAEDPRRGPAPAARRPPRPRPIGQRTASAASRCRRPAGAPACGLQGANDQEEERHQEREPPQGDEPGRLESGETEERRGRRRDREWPSRTCPRPRATAHRRGGPSASDAATASGSTSAAARPGDALPAREPQRRGEDGRGERDAGERQGRRRRDVARRRRPGSPRRADRARRWPPRPTARRGRPAAPTRRVRRRAVPPGAASRAPRRGAPPRGRRRRRTARAAPSGRAPRAATRARPRGRRATSAKTRAAPATSGGSTSGAPAPERQRPRAGEGHGEREQHRAGEGHWRRRLAVHRHLDALLRLDVHEREGDAEPRDAVDTGHRLQHERAVALGPASHREQSAPGCGPRASA